MCMRQYGLKKCHRGHSHPQSLSFLGHVVLKHGALEATVTWFQKISDILLHICRSCKYHCSWSSFHWGKIFTSWATPKKCLLWDLFSDGSHWVDSTWIHCYWELKGEHIKWNQLNTLLVCRTETDDRLSYVCELMFCRNKYLESKGVEIEIMREWSQSKMVPMSCKCYLISKRFLKQSNSCVVLLKWTGK